MRAWWLWNDNITSHTHLWTSDEKQRRPVSWNEQKYTSKTCVCIWHWLYQKCFCNRDLLVRVKRTNVWVTSHLKKIIMSQPTCILCVLSTPIRMLQTVAVMVKSDNYKDQLWSVMTMLDRDISHYHDTVPKLLSLLFARLCENHVLCHLHSPNVDSTMPLSLSSLEWLWQNRIKNHVQQDEEEEYINLVLLPRFKNISDTVQLMR